MASKQTLAKTAQPGANLPAKYDYGQDAGGGFEGQTQDHRLLPFLTVLQPLSPQVMKGALKAGALFNPVTEESFTQLFLMPVVCQRRFVEWVPREKGGGFVAEHLPDSPLVKQVLATGRFGKLTTPNGNELVESFKLFAVLDLGEGRLEPVIISFESTKIKVYKKLNTQLARFQVALPDGKKVTPPMWAHRTKLTTEMQENNKGKWFNLVWGPAESDLKSSLLTPDDPRYAVGKEFHALIQAEQVSADYGTVDRSHAAADDADDRTPF